ncbi:hypothetical protein [Candidatus Binatus sp.]|uniref:hypothetical protein n=1 Tax=Candidatus Binatus sp. TaxID=2811406 RepID=UPI003BB1970E
MSKFSRRLGFLSRGTFAVAVVALVMIGFGASRAAANESIVGLWQITLKDSGGNFIDSVFSGWTSDGLEFDQDIVPILTENVCYGTWIKLGGHSYGLTHPFFDFVGTTGLWDGTSGHFEYTVTVANDGNSFTGKENFTFEVPGTNPYAGGGTTFTGFTISATRITVNKSLLP